VIPRDALLRYPDGSFTVFVLRDGPNGPTALERPVKLGGGGAQIEVVEGIEPNDRVVVRGNERLRSGQSVRIVEGD
jgi:multidrug efflux pump subunit AcrA (membrane-fusion protein)